MNEKTNRRSKGFTLIEMLVVIAVIGLLASIALPAVQSARETGRSAQCQNNLRQLGMGTLVFVNVHSRLPSSLQPAAVTNSPRVAALTMLLPYVGHESVFQRYDRTKNFDDAANLPFTTKQVSGYLCPSSPNPMRLDGDSQAATWTPRFGITDYSPLLGIDRRLKTAGLVDEAGPGALSKNSTHTLDHIRDGHSFTIMYSESAGRPLLFRRRSGQAGDTPAVRVNGGAWSRPESDFMVDGFSRDGLTTTGTCGVNCTNGELVTNFPDPYHGVDGTGEIFSFHPGGAYSVFADGSVRLIDEEIDIRELAKLVTRCGREPNL